MFSRKIKLCMIAGEDRAAGCRAALAAAHKAFGQIEELKQRRTRAGCRQPTSISAFTSAKSCTGISAAANAWISQCGGQHAERQRCTRRKHEPQEASTEEPCAAGYEDPIVAFAFEQPAFGQLRIANELKNRKRRSPRRISGPCNAAPATAAVARDRHFGSSLMWAIRLFARRGQRARRARIRFQP